MYSQAAGVQKATCKVPMTLRENSTFRRVESTSVERDATLPFNDPRLSCQWHYNNTGAVSGEAVPVAQAGNVDLALLQIHAKHLPHVTVVPSDTVLPGQTITVIGNPRRLQNTISSGLISQIRKKADGVLWHQISAPISPSSSGSPVFDHNGNVISVVFGSYKGEGNQNLNFSVPSNYLIQLVKAAGLQLPPSTEEENAQTAKPIQTDNPVWAHLKKSWSILMRLLHAK